MDLLNLFATIVLTLAVVMAILLATAATHGGGANAAFLTARALGIKPKVALAFIRYLRLEVPYPGWRGPALGLRGGADRVNEYKQNVIDKKAALLSQESVLDAVLKEQAKAKAHLTSLLEKKAAGTLSKDEGETTLPQARVAAQGFEDRLEAQREIIAGSKKDVAQLEKDLHAEEQRLAAEDKKLAATPSGRVVNIEDAREKRAKDPKRGFDDHKDFFASVMRFGITGGRELDERLKPLAAVKRMGRDGGNQHTPFAAIGSDEQGVYSDPHGGFLVPAGIAPGILSVAPEDDPLAGLITDVPMMSPTVSFNARVDKDHSTSVSGGFQVVRRAETIEGTPSRAVYEQVVLTANEEFGLAFATERIIADSPQSFVAIIQAGFRDEYVAAAMRERINGTGVGERQGLLRAGCLITVAKQGGQPADTIQKENIDKMAARCWKYERAVWLANHNTRPQLKSLVQVIGTGGNSVPYFTRENGVEVLDGRPIKFTEFAKTLGDLGDLILFVPSEYLEGTYQSEQYAESIHVRFTAAERAFRFYRRNDGRCWWTAPLTPANGDTLSPVVVLAARA